VSLVNDRDRLESLYDDFAHRIYAYALRNTGPNDADDVLSETFAVAWQRIDVVPERSLPWLLRTAANLIRNRRRAEVRRTALVTVLGGLYHDESPPVDDVVAERDLLLAALDRLTILEREALLLIAWDGLDIAEAAEVSGCAARAFRARLARARARLASEITRSTPSPAAPPSVLAPKEIHP
jgi:RNA polymerase sigma-70 factor (ECF subfamily)